MKNPRMFQMLQASAVADRERALMSLELLSDHPAGIGDHSTDDFYKNAEQALALLADAEDRLETLRRHFPDEIDAGRSVHRPVREAASARRDQSAVAAEIA